MHICFLLYYIYTHINIQYCSKQRANKQNRSQSTAAIYFYNIFGICLYNIALLQFSAKELQRLTAVRILYLQHTFSNNPQEKSQKQKFLSSKRWFFLAFTAT